jgi:hypothetical protein
MLVCYLSIIWSLSSLSFETVIDVIRVQGNCYKVWLNKDKNHSHKKLEKFDCMKGDYHARTIKNRRKGTN